MKKIQLFYLEYCPYCKKTRKDLEALLKLEKYAQVQIEWIEESKEAELANQYDYYYVPCFYVDGVKMKEGALEYKDVQQVLDVAVN